ncbi:MAG: hypothetical protein IJJ40_04135 [Clostridia bacterium]|nr:hypothetical protein [Clostridia bacterium]
MKSDRQTEILKIIEEQIICTQDDLQNALNKLGFKATQSTVSRDIKQLRLVKGHDNDGNYRYINSISDRSNEGYQKHYSEIITNSVIKVDYALNNVVIKCQNGMAQSVCVAVDVLFNDKMLGSIAGDDTVLIITKTEQNAENLSNEIKTML